MNGNKLFVKQVIHQKELFLKSPRKFVDVMSRYSLNYSKLPLEFIAALFSENPNNFGSLNFSSNTLHVTEWLVLSSISIGLKKFKLARALREQALERALEYTNTYNPSKWLRTDQIIGALIETQNISSLTKYVRVAKLLSTGCGSSEFSDKLLSIIEGNSPAVTDSLDSEYRQFLLNKSIAIVGPLVLSDQTKEEIKMKDVVITINDHSLFKGRTYPEIRPDIIFYTGKSQEPLENKAAKSDFQYLPKFLVYKKDKHYSPFLKNRTRLRDDINPFTFSGALNMVPRVILDVLLHGASDIKVYGIDLYTTLDFSSSYDGKSMNEWAEAFEEFIAHDLITNFKFLHTLWLKKLYKADERLEQVMNMGLDGYLDYFEEKSFAVCE